MNTANEHDLLLDAMDVETPLHGVEMPTTRICIYCAEPGMGKTAALARMVIDVLGQGGAARYFDFASLPPEEAIHRFREVVRWSRSQRKNQLESAPIPFVACDNVPVGDECDADRLARLVRRLVEEGGSIAMGILPEDEQLVDQLGEARCYWSCDLRLTRPKEPHDAEIYDRYTNGIPALTKTLKDVDVSEVDAVPADLRYQETYLSLVEQVLRPGMIEDEKQLRCAMLLLGAGSLEDLQTALGSIDELLWRLLARDAPLFGVNRSQGTFSCVGGHSVDCLNVVFSLVCQYVQPWPFVISRVCRLLADRGDFWRAAVVSLMCADDTQKCALGLAWGPRMIDAGEVSVAEDALETARGLGFNDLAGFDETACVLYALGEVDAGDLRVRLDKPIDEVQAHTVRAALDCRRLLRGERLEEERVLTKAEDPLVLALDTHARALWLLLRGRLEDSFELLLESPQRFDEPSIACSMLAVDYALCSLLMGMVPGPLDLGALRTARTLFERAGLAQCVSLFDAALAMGGLFGGRAVGREAFEAHVQRATRAHDIMLRGIFLLASGVCDMRVGALTRAHVRLSQAKDVFCSVGATELKKIVGILDIAVRAQLGERILAAELRASRGVTSNMDGVVRLLGNALLGDAPKRAGIRGWKSKRCPRDIHWIVNILSNDCGAVSKRFQQVMPVTWSESIAGACTLIDELAAQNLPSYTPHRAKSKEAKAKDIVDAAQSETTLEIHMLGGFEIFVGGCALPSNRLDRRRAKALLALLAATPGHSAKRYTIMESIWPAYDYRTANKCLYSATCVLRSELSSALGDDSDVKIVLTNKGESSVALDARCVRCDIDVFEEKARAMLDLEGNAHKVVAMCREVEELYRGDLVVPPTDGMGLVQDRAQQLKDLFADAMVAGSNAAHEVGMKSLACRFARKACDADGLREDAMRALVVALCSSGRHIEAERRYERFVSRVVDVTKRPPSRELRDMVQDALQTSLGRRKERRKKASGAQLSFGFDDVVTSDEDDKASDDGDKASDEDDVE